MSPNPAKDLHTLSARGQFAKTWIYWVQNGVQYRKPYKAPANPRSVPQQTNRGLFADSVAAWQGEAQPTKDAYNLRASKIRPLIEGFNLYIREYMLGIIP